MKFSTTLTERMDTSDRLAEEKINSIIQGVCESCLNSLPLYTVDFIAVFIKVHHFNPS
jgi:hypothetical protein